MSYVYTHICIWSYVNLYSILTYLGQRCIPRFSLLLIIMVYGGLRSARWLRNLRQAPMVTAFRNLETGQVLYSQTLYPQQFYIDQQFRWPNWQNRKPQIRRDMWRAMAVTELPTWDSAVQMYKNLVQLRTQRDLTMKAQAMAWRRKNSDGNIWFWNQYRPTYTQEAVADICSALEAINLGENRSAIVHWEHMFRKGSEDVWSGISAEHREIAPFSMREQSVALNEIRKAALQRAQTVDAEEAELKRERDAVCRAQNKPTEDELAELAMAEREMRLTELHVLKQEKHRELLSRRPDLAELERRAEAITAAEAALVQAKKSFDPFTPRGQRGLAKKPIKQCTLALRIAQKSYDDLKSEIDGRSSLFVKVPQNQERLQINKNSL